MLINSKETIFLLFNINKFIIDVVVDIKRYPTIRANVPIYFGRNIIDKINRADEIE